MLPGQSKIEEKMTERFISSLESRRGNIEKLQSILEVYRQKGYINEAENIIFLHEFMTPADSKTSNPQTNNPQENAEWLSALSKRVELTARNSSLKNRVENIVIASFLLILGFSLIFISNYQKVEEPISFAHAVNSATVPDSDCLIEDMEILYQYAELYTVRNKDDKDEDENQNSTTDFYLAVVTDPGGTDYLVSISFDHNSEIAEELRNFDFENSNYVMSGYFTPESLYGHVTDYTVPNPMPDEFAFSKTDLGDLYYEEYELYELFGYEKVGQNFDFLYPEDIDYYEEEEKSEKVPVFLLAAASLLIGAVMMFFIVRKTAKRMKVKAEIKDIDRIIYAMADTRKGVGSQQNDGVQ